MTIPSPDVARLAFAHEFEQLQRVDRSVCFFLSDSFLFEGVLPPAG